MHVRISARGRARSAAGLGALLAATVAVALQSSSTASTVPHIVVRHGVTQPVFSYRNAVRETVYVQVGMDLDMNGRLDLLATDIIRPRETEQGMKVPVIYEMSPYYQTLGRGNESETKNPEDGDFVPDKFPLNYDNYFVPRGYAFVAQDMPGTRNSEGCMVLGGREELLAAKATINWLNGKGKAFLPDGLTPVTAGWSDGSVGMIGKSYDGTIANGAAATGVPGLKTIVPISGISRWYDYHLNQGAQYENAYTTPELFTFVIDQQPADDPQRGIDWVTATFGENGPCTKRALDINSKAGDPRANYSRFWDARDYLRHVNRVHASVFIAHGSNDQNVKPNNFVQWWAGLERNHVPRKIWLSQTGHVDPFDYRRAEWVRTLHRWFDRWLYGIRNGIMAEPQASIERAPAKWKDYRRWPSPQARRVSLWLRERTRNPQGPGVLSLKPGEKDATRDYTDDDDQSIGEYTLASHFRQQKPYRLVFLTPRLPRDVRVSGPIRIVLRASVDKPDTDFTALLVDYGEGRKIVRDDYNGAGEGVETLGTQSCWGQSTKADDACYLDVREVPKAVNLEVVTRGFLGAKHHRTLRHITPLQTGKVYTFRWELWGDDWIFRGGDRLGVVIAGNDAKFLVPVPTQATVTVHTKGSRIVLPVVGGAAALRH